jgi:hypothetical protein
LDNNLAPAFAGALHALSKKDNHTVEHLRDRFSPDTPDIAWIEDLKNRGGWTIISQDHFRKSDLEKKAFRECGLVVFCLDKHWVKAKYWDKAHNLVRWWPPIIEQANLISGGAAFRIPWRLTGKGRFEQISF